MRTFFLACIKSPSCSVLTWPFLAVSSGETERALLEEEGLAWQLAGAGGGVPEMSLAALSFPWAPRAEGQGGNCSPTMPGRAATGAMGCLPLRLAPRGAGPCPAVWLCSGGTLRVASGASSPLPGPQGCNTASRGAPTHSRAPPLPSAQHVLRGSFSQMLPPSLSPDAPYAHFAEETEAPRWALTCPRLPSGPEGRAGTRTVSTLRVIITVIILPWLMFSRVTLLRTLIPSRGPHSHDFI